MPEKMSIQVKVRNHHIDWYGHVNNAQYLTYLEEARTDILEKLGFTLPGFNERGIQIFITEIKLKYKGAARLDDRLTIYGWFKDISSRRATWGHEIYNQRTGALLLTGEVSGMFLLNGKIIPVPADVRAVMMRIYLPTAQ